MRIPVGTLGLVVVIGVVTMAQSPGPNLAGHWIQDVPRPEAAGVGPMCGGQCIITQDEKTFTVGVVGPEARAPVTLRVDGTLATITFGAATITMSARWQGDALLITRSLGVDRLAIQGGRLVISHTGSGRGGDGTKFIYQRVKQ